MTVASALATTHLRLETRCVTPALCEHPAEIEACIVVLYDQFSCDNPDDTTGGGSNSSCRRQRKK
jgi:hypothetical protein